MLKAVDKFAEIVDDMHLGTANGPMRFGAPDFKTT
jgi:hypothetical protein